MKTIPEIKEQMYRAEWALRVLAIGLYDYPEHQKEVYGAAEMLAEWQEEFGNDRH